jgi:hypothetical protein
MGKSSGTNSKWLFRSILEAYRSWGMFLGMAFGVVAIVSLCARLFSLALAKGLMAVIDAYRAVFHTMVDWLLFWVPFELPWWAKDVLVLWCIGWGALVRIILIVYAAELRDRKAAASPLQLDVIFPIIGGLFNRGYLLATVGILISFLTWPYVLVQIALRWPYFFAFQREGVLSGVTVRHGKRLDLYLENRGEFLFDIRLLYIVQIVTMAAAACAVIWANGLLKNLE